MAPATRRPRPCFSWPSLGCWTCYLPKQQSTLNSVAPFAFMQTIFCADVRTQSPGVSLAFFHTAKPISFIHVTVLSQVAHQNHGRSTVTQPEYYQVIEMLSLHSSPVLGKKLSYGLHVHTPTPQTRVTGPRDMNAPLANLMFQHKFS